MPDPHHAPRAASAGAHSGALTGPEAAVQAVVGYTLCNAADLDTARKALDGRLLALAKGHDILTRRNWEGASIAEVIAEAIERVLRG